MSGLHALPGGGTLITNSHDLAAFGTSEMANQEAKIKDEQNKINQYQDRLNMAPVMEQQFADITRDYDQSKTDYE